MSDLLSSARRRATPSHGGQSGSSRVALVAVAWLCANVWSGGSAAADAIPGEQFCAGNEVVRIAFEGNDVTRREVLLREVVQPIGEHCSLDLVIDSIQNLFDLGLFNGVRAEIDAFDAGVRVRFVVREKFFFLAVPRLSRTSDRELRAGVQLRWDNFTGRLHELKLTSEFRQENDGEGDAGYVHSFDYEIPRFFASDYGLSVSGTAVDREAELSREGRVFGRGMERAHALGFSVTRWLNRYAGIEGLRVFAGLGWSERRYEDLNGELGPFEVGQNVAARFGAETVTVHRDRYRRRGRRAGAAITIGQEALGSDFEHHRLDAWAAWYLPLGRDIRNLNLQLRLGVSDGAPYGRHAYSIGGGELMRGLEPDEIEGDFLALVNLEYLQGLFTYPTVRWVVFADAGNVYDKDAIDPFEHRLRVGAGLRWKLQSLTNTDLRIDLAWDPAEGSLKPYASTSLTF